MRFQGEICTFSYGLHFSKNQVLINGTVWPRRTASTDLRQYLPRLRFNGLLSDEEFVSLHHWLLTDTPDPLNLHNAIRQVRRRAIADSDTVWLEVELRTDQVPSWWDWPVRFPLCVRLEMRSNEFDHLTQSLSRERWSTDSIW